MIDRTLIVDTTDGKTATAKNPRKWPTMFTCKATYMNRLDSEDQVPPVQIILPNGVTVTSEQPDLDQTLSQLFKREVRLVALEQGQGQRRAGASSHVLERTIRRVLAGYRGP